MPSWLAVAGSRLRGYFAARRLDSEFDAEIEEHLQLLVQDEVRRGSTPEAARRAAALRFGGVAQVKEHQREHRGLPFLEASALDLRYALRSLTRHKTFTLVAVFTLAIGIGAGTAVFNVASAVLLRPLPYRDPGELVRVFETNPLRGWTRNIASPANYADWRRQSVAFSDLAAYEQFNSEGSGASDVFLTGQGDAQSLKALSVTGNLFAVLGTPPLLGRVFTDAETFEGQPRVVIISHSLWQNAFGGVPNIVGTSIVLSARTYEVVGVMPPQFFFPGKDVQAWLPVAYAPSVFENSRRPHWLGVIARRRPGISLAQAQHDMDQVAADLERRYPDTNTQMGVRLEGLHDSFAYEPAPAFKLVSVTMAVLFLMICVNTANLQLGRGLDRGRELAIRGALGAAGQRLVRQLLTESLVISVAGGMLGFVLAVTSQLLLTRYAASILPVFVDVGLDAGVVLTAAALALLAPIVFGVVPALSAVRAAEAPSRTTTASRRTERLRAILVASEVALSFMLAVAALLLVRSLTRLQSVEPGFTPDHAIAFTITLPTARYADAGARYATFTDIERSLSDLPSVQHVGAVSRLALRGSDWTSDGTVEGRAPTDFERELRHKSISPGYFSAAGVPLVAGRFFDEHDTREATRVTIVNQSLATRYFRGEDPIGRRIRFGRPTDTGPWITIVGVVGNEKQDGLERTAQPEAFVPITQQLQNPLTFVIRSTLTPEAMLAIARERVRAVDKDLTLTAATTLGNLVRQSTLERRLRTVLITGFATIALMLAALGIYGVLSYAVSQRSREIGLRLALGARPSRLFSAILGQGLEPVAVGMIVGLGGALLMTRLAQSLLFGIEAVDPASYATATAALIVVASTACAVPAWRATTLDPLTTLRQE